MMLRRSPVPASLIVLVFSVSCGGSDPDPGTGRDSGPDNGIDAEPVGGDDLRALSDEFDGANLDSSWQLFRPELVDLSVDSGALHLAPNQQVLWFNQSQGPLVYKLVSGDFRISTTVRARLASDPTMPPDQDVHLGGLTARAPVALGDGAREDYVFIVVGFDVDDLSVETKTTDDGTSVFVGPSWPFGGDAELRICRIGTEFHLYKRQIDSTEWTLAITYDRPDMPADLQVGALAYANTATPDLRASFDSLRFAPVSGLADCTVD